MLPDRQIVYTLEYLRNAMNANKYAQEWLDTSDLVVDTTLARNPKRPVVYKDEYLWELFPAQMPYLALWRNTNSPDRSGTFTETKASCGIGWFAEIPAPSEEHDGETWGRTFASNVWHIVKELLEDVPVATMQKAGFKAIWLGDGDIDVDQSETVCGFIAPLTIDHTVPPYQIDDPENLVEVAASIKLYDSAQDPSAYQGLTTEAEIEP
jgi:hypothetical protein